MPLDTDIAVIGIGCRFPPDTTGPQAFWRFLQSRGDAVGEVPPDRWRSEAYYDSDPAKPGRMHVRRGAFLAQPIEALDAAFFRISAREAGHIDPQQRLLLEVSWEALEDAGLNISQLEGSETGVFVGAFTLDNLVQRNEPAAVEDMVPQTALSATLTVLASRLAYFYDFRGPCFTVDTACSSSLVAVHQAVEALRAGHCDLALVGGVNRIFRPETSLMMAKAQFLAADGRSKSFSANADGYGRGEGCGVVVLRRLADARQNGDRIYAVVEASGVNQDGRTGGPASPSTGAQADLLAAVLRRADVEPRSVAYVEAHGTGTAVGDPAELRALGQVLGQHPDRVRPCIVGSVKAGIGHLEGAAGIAGLIKALLSTFHREVPPQAWLDELNPNIDFEGLGLQVASEPTSLEGADGPLRVGVNSFGYGGTNAHVLLRENLPVDEPTASGPGMFFEPVGLVSAHSESAVQAMAKDYEAGLRDAGSDLDELATLLAAYAGRTHHGHRVAALGDIATIADRVRDVAEGRAHPDVMTGRVARRVAPTFVFSGMGPQWWAMGRGLLESHTAFRDHAEHCDRVFRRLAGWSILNEMLASRDASRMSRTAVAQPANFVLQTGLALVLAEVGVVPAAIVGHSVGEVAAAQVAGALDLEDALTVVYHRSRLQASTAGAGAMLATDLSADDARELVEALGPTVAIAAVNGPNATTLAGEVATLETAHAQLSERGRFSRQLRVEVAYHSPAMDPILHELRSSLRDLSPQKPAIPLVSSVGAEHDHAAWDADYWVANTREAVRFHAAAERLLDQGSLVFVELGPHPVLGLYLHQISDGDGTAVVGTLHRDRPDGSALTACVAQAWTKGVPVNWDKILGTAPAGLLPTYPWQRETHWQEPAAVRRQRTREADGGLAMSGTVAASAPPSWDVDLSPTTFPWCRDHRVGGDAVLPAAAFLDILFSHAPDLSAGPAVVENLRVERPVVLGDRDDPVLRLALQEHGEAIFFSRRRGEPEGWRRHGTARISRGTYTPPDASLLEASRRADDLVELAPDDLYERFTDLGLEYQGEFRAIRRIRANATSVIAEIEADGSAVDGYAAFPPLLDAALQSALALDGSKATGLFVVSQVKRAVLHGRLPARLTVCAALRGVSLDGAEFDVRLWDGECCLAELEGVELRSVAMSSDPDEAWLDERSFELAWEPLPELHRVDVTPEAWLVLTRDPELLSLGDGSPLQVTADSDLPTGIAKLSLGRFGALVIDCGTADGGAVNGATDPNTRRAEEVVDALRCISEMEESERPAEVVLVTRGALAVLPTDEVDDWCAGWVTGLRRAAANELTNLRIRHVDHDGRCWAGLRAAILDSDVEELATRAEGHWAPTLERLPALRRASTWWTQAPQRAVSDRDNYRLVSGSRSVEGLLWVREPRRAPGRGEVELRIEAVGLNYKDVAKQLGLLDDRLLSSMFTGSELGMEQCAVVERVGEGLTAFRKGQRFLASIPGGFRRYVTVDPDDVRLVGIEPSWDPKEAAGQLVALATAHQTLAELARLKPGETVLIHGAAGGVGQAAINVARACGAEVLATAGSREKRDELRQLGVTHAFPSRTFDFVPGVLRATLGRGVDVVLNTIPGDGLRAALEVIAEDGRVVEIGRREIIERGVLPLELLDKNVTLISFDLDRVARDPRRFTTIAEQVLKRVRDGSYAPVAVTAFSPAQVADAFDRLARSEHRGKLVVDLADRTGLICREPDVAAGPVRADRWYLITGGTGGLGILTATWLAGRGARHVVLTSRRGELDGPADKAVDALRERGVDIEAHALDVTDRAAVSAFLSERRRAGEVLGGIVHCAGVSHDVPLAAIGRDDVRSVMRPKLVGAANLDAAARDDPLDFFLLTSSVSAFTGTSGQAAYAAANAALESFAHWRRRQGRPASAVGFGPVADVGMAAKDASIERYVKLLGFEPLPVERFGRIMERALAWNRPVLGVWDIDWSAWALAEPRAAASARVATIMQQALTSDGAAPGAVRQRLDGLGDNERQHVLSTLVADILVTVLGGATTRPGPEDSLETLGLDSLMLVELQTGLNHALGAELSLMGLLDSQTIGEVAVRLDEFLQATKD